MFGNCFRSQAFCPMLTLGSDKAPATTIFGTGERWAGQRQGRVLVTPKYFSYYAAPTFSSCPCAFCVCMWMCFIFGGL